MGAVKFDLTSEEIRLRDLSLNSVEDIYNFINMLDVVYDEHVNGNTYATCLYTDFQRIIDSIGVNVYIKTFVDIQIGHKPITQSELYAGLFDIEEVSATRLNVDTNVFLKGLRENVEEAYNIVQYQWLEYINKYYKNKLIKDNVEKTENRWEVDEERLKELDALMKYSHSRRTYQDNIPTEIKQLYDYREKLAEQIKYLDKQKKKYHKKNKERYFDYKQKASKLKTFKIQVDKDISILKRHYGISIENKNAQGQLNAGNNISYNINNGEVLSAHENQIDSMKLEQYNELFDKVYVGKIKEIAEKHLNSRQIIIFELYYFVGMKQREIADMTGIQQPNVARDLDVIIGKLKKEIAF